MRNLTTTIILLVVIVQTAYSGVLQDAGGKISKGAKDAGGVITDAGKDVGGELARGVKVITGPVNSTIEICGVEITVSSGIVWACKDSAVVLPGTCGAAATVTGGGPCATNITFTAAACGVGVATIAAAAAQCIKKAAGN